jgi:hypothetical protein
MEMQQMFERLLVGQVRLLKRMDAYHEERMAMSDAHQKRMIAYLGETDANTEKINLGMMQSAEEHQDVPSEDVAVMPVKGLKKRRRGRKSTAGRRGEPKELNRGNCRSRKKLAAACRKVSRHAGMVWRKRKLFRRTGTQEICGRRKELAIAGIRRTTVRNWYGARDVVMKERRSNKDDG